MQIDYISDLHLDFHVPFESPLWPLELSQFLSKLLPEKFGDILILAGDLSHYNEQSYMILNFFGSLYDQVLFVMGNHDYYLLPGESTFENSKQREEDLLAYVKDSSKVHCLSYFETFEYNGVTFVGATSWYPLQSEREKHVFYNHMNDCKLIREFDIAATHQLEMNAFAALAPVDVLITHMPPTRIDSHDFWGSTDCFLNTLPSSAAKIFIFGHCHEQHIYEKDDAYYCINALGYPREGLKQKIRSINITV